MWHLPPPLDLEAMSRAAALLTGRHDFAAFTRPSEAKRRPTERQVLSAGLRRARRLAFLDIEANAFLPHMVRRIMGALAEVGQGRRSVADFGRLLREARPGEASCAAQAQGLCLMKVRYESRLFDDETDEDI